MSARPVWRSLQYVPAHIEKYVATAHTRGADAIILDLEDSVPPDQKAHARAQIAAAARQCGQAGADILVRINSDDALAADDIAAVVSPAVTAVYLPKVESAAHLLHFEAQISAAEARQGMPTGHTGLVALIETAAGWLDMPAIAKASPRVKALSLGSEDFAADAGIEPSEETLRFPKQQLIIASAAAGVMSLGLIGVQTRFDDPEGYLAMARRSRGYGFAGSSCIHPSQIPLLNQAFSPTPEELSYARQVVDGAAEAQAAGLGAFAIKGKMIDAPIVARAQAVLDSQAAIESREARRKTVAG